MKTQTSRAVLSLALTLSAATAWAQPTPAAHELQTRFGTVTPDAKGYPDQQSIDTLDDEIGYQRATQAYLWAMTAQS